VDRRQFIKTSAGISLTMAVGGAGQPRATLQTRGRGDVATTTFYRHDLKFSSGRLHEPSADEQGNLWFSPLDGRLMKYHTPTGKLDILDLEQLTGKPWKGLHLWPVARGREVYLCSPAFEQLWVYDTVDGPVQQYALPHLKPQVYGGFSVPEWPFVYLYDTRTAGIVKWDPAAHAGAFIACPYELSGTLYMTFAAPRRKEIWGSTYIGNDLVRFNVSRHEWTGHWKSPLEGATPTPANAVFGETLYISDHLNGRLVPLDITSGTWGEPIPIPGFREWFGYVSGGTALGGHLYFCHSTWTGGNDSLDGKPHRFLGTWTVFDPKQQTFSRLDIPTRCDESFISAYGQVARNQLYITAVNANPPQNAVMLRSDRWNNA
jgi:streptogramin lyase